MDVSSEGTNTKHGRESWFQIQIQRFHFCISKEHTDQANISTCFLTVKVSQKDISTLRGMKKKKKWGEKSFFLFSKKALEKYCKQLLVWNASGWADNKKRRKKNKTPHDMTHNFNILGLCFFFFCLFWMKHFRYYYFRSIFPDLGIYYFNFGSKLLFYRLRK